MAAQCVCGGGGGGGGDKAEGLGLEDQEQQRWPWVCLGTCAARPNPLLICDPAAPAIQRSSCFSLLEGPRQNKVKT